MQYLVSVIDDTAGLATPDERRPSTCSTTGSRRRVTGSSPVASGAQLGHRHRQPGRGGDVHRRALPGVEGVSRGFWIIEAADLDVALKLAAEGSKACNRKIEVRPFL
jgi:Uncharacterized protein conserved in bacteria